MKIEDPEEIWIDHPHVITLEARDAPPGSDIPGYSITDAVNDGMRLSPRWLIVGEVRKGAVALDLFSAQMSGHSGMSTFHAESPDEAVHRMTLMMFGERGVRFEAAKGYFISAIDAVIQVGWVRKNKRGVQGVWSVRKKLSGGQVTFEDIWLMPNYRDLEQPDRAKELKQFIYNDNGKEEASAL